MTRFVTAAVVIALLAAAPLVAAQEREHIVATYVVAPGQPVSLQSETAVRAVVRGSYTCSIDASEIDALEITSQTSVVENVRPVVFPDGTRVVERRGPHEYLVEIPPGPDMAVRLNTEGIAARLLVTSSDVRDSLVGVIQLDVLAPVTAADSVATVATQPRVASLVPPLAFGSSALGASLLGLAFVLVRRRRETVADALSRRARQARAAIVREARVLGPAFAGALAGTAELERAADAQREHVRALDRALTRTSWVSGESASSGRSALATRRDEALARLATVVACLEETVVRLAACVADRSAIAGLAREVARVRVEVEIGETVEQELSSL